jgi:hypothetical protein
MRKAGLLIALFISLFVEGQAPEKFYTKFGGSGIDVGYGVKTTLDKQYIVIGSTTSYGAGFSDAYLVKVDSMGIPIWSKTFGGFGNDVGTAVVQLNDSGYVFSGYTNSYGSGGYDAYLVRTDKNGNLIWQKTFGGTDWDFAYDLEKASDGGIVMCGSTSSFGKGNKDAFLVKHDQAGTLVWQKFFGGVEHDDFKGIYTNNGTDFFAAGNTQSYGEINGDMFCFKVDNNGDSLVRIIHGGASYDGANDVIVDSNNDIVLAGGSNSFSNGKMDAFFAKFSPTGTYILQNNFGEAAHDEEAYKIIKSASPILAEHVAIFSTREAPGNKTDIKTIYMNQGLLWFGGQASGSFGFTGEDEALDICSYKDKGYVQVGFTTSFASVERDVFFIKRDSTLNYGSSIVGVKNNTANEMNLLIYPNPVKENKDVCIKGSALNSGDYTVEVYSVTSAKIYSDYIKENNNFSYFVPFHKWESGMYVLVVEKNGVRQHYKIIKQ